jgi:hypothetical protein
MGREGTKREGSKGKIRNKKEVWDQKEKGGIKRHRPEGLNTLVPFNLAAKEPSTT